MDDITLQKGDNNIDCSLSDGNEINLYTNNASCVIVSMPEGWDGLVMTLCNRSAYPIKLGNNNPKVVQGKRFNIGKETVLEPMRSLDLIKRNSRWEILK